MRAIRRRLRNRYLAYAMELLIYHGIEQRKEGRLKMKIFNREICVCALLATNSFMRRKQRRNGEKHGKTYDKSGFINRSSRKL